MTYTATLSARIAALEAQAAPLNELNAELAQLVERCNIVSCRIQDAVQAQHLLAELGGHAQRLFGGLVNAEPISEPMPEVAPQTEAPAPQSDETEGPASTAEVLMEAQPEPSINAGSNSEPDDQRTAMDIMVDWAATLSGPVTVAQAAEQTGIPEGTVKNYLPALVKKGLLERVPGTGVTGRPGQFCPVGSAPAPAPKPAPTPKPLAEVKTDHLPRDLPPLTQSSVQATAVEVEIVQGALKNHGRPMSKSLLLGRLSKAGIKAAALDDALRQLEAAGKLAVSGGQFALAGAA